MKKEQFVLIGIKVLKNSTEIQYNIPTTEGDDKITITPSRNPHPDLKKAIEKLKKYLANLFYKEEDSDRIRVNGISLGESNNDPWVIIKGMLTLQNTEFPVSINSHRINMNAEILGYEEELFEQIEIIRNEVFAYLFESKQAQQTIDLPEEEKSSLEEDTKVNLA